MATPDHQSLEQPSEEALHWLQTHKAELENLLKGKPDPHPDPKPAPRLAKSVAICLRIPSELVQEAKRHAEQLGIGYQTLMKHLIREGLDRLESRPPQPPAD